MRGWGIGRREGAGEARERVENGNGLTATPPPRPEGRTSPVEGEGLISGVAEDRGRKRRGHGTQIRTTTARREEQSDEFQE